MRCLLTRTKSQLTPIRIAKQIASRKPSVHPLATSMAVVAVRIYMIVIRAKRVNMIDREEKRTTKAAAPTAIAALPYAVYNI